MNVRTFLTRSVARPGGLFATTSTAAVPKATAPTAAATVTIFSSIRPPSVGPFSSIASFYLQPSISLGPYPSSYLSSSSSWSSRPPAPLISQASTFHSSCCARLPREASSAPSSGDSDAAGSHRLRRRLGASSESDPNVREIKRKEKYEPVELETSIQYLKSDAFAKTYEGLPVWHETLYRRNYKGSWNPIRTRPDCYIYGVLCPNPCPICRDENLVVHHENLELIKQFIEPQTGAVLSHRKTNVCLLQHRRIEIAIGRARDRGLLEMRVPHRDYDYADYYSKELLEECQYEDILSQEEQAFLSKTKDVAERQLGRNDVLFHDAFQLDDDDDDIFSEDSDSDSEDGRSRDSIRDS